MTELLCFVLGFFTALGVSILANRHEWRERRKIQGDVQRLLTAVNFINPDSLPEKPL